MIELKDKLRAMIFCKMYAKKVSEQIEGLKKQRNHVQVPSPVHKPLENEMSYKRNRYSLIEKKSYTVQYFYTQIIITFGIMILLLLGTIAVSFLLYKKFSPSVSEAWHQMCGEGFSQLDFRQQLEIQKPITYLVFIAVILLVIIYNIYNFLINAISDFWRDIDRIEKIEANNALYYKEQKKIDLVNSAIQKKNLEIKKKNAIIKEQNRQMDNNYKKQYNNAIAVVDRKIAVLEKNRIQAENTLEKIRIHLNMNPEYAKNAVDLLQLYDQVKYANSYGNNFGKLQTDYKNIIKPQNEMHNYLLAINNIGTQILQKLDVFNTYISKLNTLTENGFNMTNENLAEFQHFFNNKFTALDAEINRLHNIN